MKKVYLVLGALMCASAALAQDNTIQFTAPVTNGESYDTATGANGNKATVQQKVNLILPQATGLHLTANELNFDISQIGQQGNDWACVYGNNYQGNDVSSGFDGGWSGQKQTLPLGVAYTTANLPFGKINVPGKKVTSYPPIEFTGSKDAGNLVAGSKNHFVCFRIFKLQKFSNLGNFDLTVTRSGGMTTADAKPGGNPGSTEGTFQVYMQDNPCYVWNRAGNDGGNATGLYEVKQGGTIHLIPKAMGVGTTGALAASSPENCFAKDKDGNYQGKSWLDDLVVVAVKVDGDKFGKNSTTLTYTLNSSAAAFQ